MIPGFYKNYKTEDFVNDVYFRKIVKEGSESHTLLEEFLSDLTEKEEEIRQAIFIIKELETKKVRHTNIHKSESWNKVVWKQRRMDVYLVSRYAAAFILLLCFGTISYQLLNKKPFFSNLESTEELLTNNRTIIIVDGQRYYVPERISTIRYSESGESICINDTLKINIHNYRKSLSQIIVPYGNNTRIVLSDGTRIWANSGSKLVTHPVFKGKTRDVYLEGEAYFEVAENRKKPFHVHTDVFQVNVTGTRFDVHAIKDEKNYDVILLEGKVSLNLNNQLFSREVVLTPNQRGSLNDGERNFKIEEVKHAENYITWVDGYMIFENEDIKNVFHKVSRYYNISIIYDSSRLHRKVYGKLLLKDNPDEVLDGLASISNSTFTKKNNTYFFRKKSHKR